jgi:F0F1-type ATP synthase beta subunit
MEQNEPLTYEDLADIVKKINTDTLSEEDKLRIRENELLQEVVSFIQIRETFSWE